jgi:RNA recognition motif-containing protein
MLLIGSVDVNLPIDKFTKKIMGFAIVKFTPPENAVKAYAEFDGTVFQVMKMRTMRFNVLSVWSGLTRFYWPHLLIITF